jgi:tetratricopeptide (TPR) repeat protein
VTFRGQGEMKTGLLGLIVCIVLFVSSPAWSQDAMHFLDMGLKSSMMNRKIHYFNKALELNPNLYSAYEKRGMIYYFQGKYTESMNDFLRAAEINPTEPEPYRVLGLNYMKTGHHDEAIAHFTRAIELNPRQASSYSHRAEVYLLTERVEEAIRDASKAIALRGEGPIIGRAYTVRSKAYNRLGQEELALEDFNKAYMLDPEHYAFRYFTITNHLASFVSDSGPINPGSVRWAGLAAIIGLLFVFIFRLVLTPPDKRDID